MMGRPIHSRSRRGGRSRLRAVPDGLAGWAAVCGVALTCLALMLLTGCNHAAEPLIAAPNQFAVEKQYSRGPVTFTLRLSQETITIAERLTLQLSVQADEDVHVTLPAFGDKLEQFGIVRYQALPPELLDQGKLLYQQTYILEPFLSGSYTIPAMEMRFAKQDEANDHVVESEPLTVTVRSLLPDEASNLAIKEIIPPMTMPASPWPWLYALMGLAGFLGLGGAAFWLWRKRYRPDPIAPIIPPHEAAYNQLQRLIAENLVDQGKIKLFYLGLSTILRHYIEDRFGLRAPERTTEEFLLDLRRTDVLLAAHKHLLADFLRHCDMVKFAEHTPTNDEIQITFDSCKQFIMETEPKPQGEAA